MNDQEELFETLLEQTEELLNSRRYLQLRELFSETNPADIAQILEELPEDTYYIADLIGCDVYEGEDLLGKVSDVFSAGGADLYEIKGKGASIYLPAIKENVLSVDIKNKIIKVKLPEGLI